MKMNIKGRKAEGSREARQDQQTSEPWRGRGDFGFLGFSLFFCFCSVNLNFAGIIYEKLRRRATTIMQIGPALSLRTNRGKTNFFKNWFCFPPNFWSFCLFGSDIHNLHTLKEKCAFEIMISF
jgi:hypothetical protein